MRLTMWKHVDGRCYCAFVTSAERFHVDDCRDMTDAAVLIAVLQLGEL